MKKKSYTPEIAIASIFAYLINKSSFELSAEGMLVLEALQRANHDLKDMSISEIGNYLSGMTKEQAQGLANNVKGIYHELLYAQQENSDGDDIYATLFPDANHPGSDIMLQRDGVDIAEIQLKATDSISDIQGHFIRYPDIPIFATSEVSDKVAGVSSSEFSNENLTDDVTDAFEGIKEQSTMSYLEDAAVMSGIVAAAMHAGDVLRGNATAKTATVEALKDIGVAVSATALVDILFL